RAALAKNPGNPELQRQLSWDYNKLGDVVGRNDAAATLQYTEKALCLRRHLASGEVGRPGGNDVGSTIIRDLPYTLDRVASLRLSVADRSGAERDFHDALGVRKYLFDKDTSNLLVLGDLAISEENISRLEISPATAQALTSNNDARKAK